MSSGIGFDLLAINISNINQYNNIYTCHLGLDFKLTDCKYFKYQSVS
jgi:hypothetical protein